jgi:hypothetical protein
MSESQILWAVLGVHLAAVCAVLWGRKGAQRPGVPLLIWMFLLPVFGPAVGWMLLRPGAATPPEAEWMRRNEEIHESIVSSPAQALQTVPLEEALLINDPRQRRLQMMNMLRADPKKYLDVLLVARFNEDPETAHYATATLMELQRQMQMELQRCQLKLKQDPGDEKARESYAALLEEYCQSGLIEGQVLRRQRLMLATALNEIFTRTETPELLAMAVRNHLELGQGQEARAAAGRMLERWPGDERSWLEMMRVCAQTHDQAGMRGLMGRAQGAPVDWTNAGRERLLYWMERTT